MRSRVRPRGKWLRSTLMTKPLQIHSFSQQILPGMEGAQRLLRPLKDNRLTYLSSLLTLQSHIVFPKVHIQLSCKIKLPTPPLPTTKFYNILSWFMILCWTTFMSILGYTLVMFTMTVVDKLPALSSWPPHFCFSFFRNQYKRQEFSAFLEPASWIEVGEINTGGCGKALWRYWKEQEVLKIGREGNI